MNLERGSSDQNRIEQDLAGTEASAFRKHSVRIFREQLNRFLSGEVDGIDLFKADYAVTGDDVAKIKVPDVDCSIREIVLVRKFRRIIAPFISKESPDMPIVNTAPNPETYDLRQYIEAHPDTKVALLNFIFNVETPLEGIENIFYKRFKDLETGHLISSVWTAIRYSPDSEYGPKEVQRRIKITPKSHVAILRPPAGVSRVR